MKQVIIKKKVECCNYCPFATNWWYFKEGNTNKCGKGIDISSVRHGEIAKACPLEEYQEETVKTLENLADEFFGSHQYPSDSYYVLLKFVKYLEENAIQWGT